MNMLFRAGLIIMIVGDIWVQRFSIPAGSDQYIPIVLFTTYLGLGLTLASGRVVGSWYRLELFAISIVFFVSATFEIARPFGPFSFFYIVILYLPFVFVCPLDDAEYQTCVQIFQWALIPVCLLALYQFVTGDRWDPVDSYFPYYSLPGYNTHPPIAYGATVLRSNGMVMLEPSFLSQYCAIGILLELLYWRKWWRICLFGLALLSSASGTGTLLLMGTIFYYAFKNKKLSYLLIIMIVIALACVMFPEAPIIHSFMTRSTEYQDQGSSGYERFVGPMNQVVTQLGDSWQNWLFGLGAGNTNEETLALYSVADRGILWAPLHLLVSYGIIGSFTFAIFICQCFFSGVRSQILAVSLFVLYCFLSGSLLQPHTVFLCFMLLSFLPQENRKLAPVTAIQGGLRFRSHRT